MFGRGAAALQISMVTISGGTSQRLANIFSARLAHRSVSATVVSWTQTRKFARCCKPSESTSIRFPKGNDLNGLLKFVAVMLNYLSREQVLTIRAEMIEAFGEEELAESAEPARRSSRAPRHQRRFRLTPEPLNAEDAEFSTAEESRNSARSTALKSDAHTFHRPVLKL
jgi:hypothetical protein